jgi:hypothetical protein
MLELSCVCLGAESNPRHGDIRSSCRCGVLRPRGVTTAACQSSDRIAPALLGRRNGCARRRQPFDMTPAAPKFFGGRVRGAEPKSLRFSNGSSRSAASTHQKGTWARLHPDLIHQRVHSRTRGCPVARIRFAATAWFP